MAASRFLFVLLLLPSFAAARNARSAVDFASWVAGEFGACTRYDTCSIAFKKRTVDCKLVFDPTVDASGKCTGPKPSALKKCDCGFIVCESAPQPASCEALEVEAASDVAPIEDYEEVGCFAKVAGDTGGNIEPKADPRDLKCMTSNTAELCQSGLPFYRVTSNAMTPSLCFSYCTSKGMDVFGLVDGAECRCGASPVNHAALHIAARQSLVFRPDRLPAMPADALDGQCGVKAFRYKGYYEEGGVPPEFLQTLQPDDDYQESIIMGHEGHGEGPDDEHNLTALLQQKALMLHSRNNSNVTEPPEGEAWNRACFPDKCGPSTPWQTRWVTPPGNQTDVWEDYVIVYYAFWKDLDDARKNAFRAGMDDLRAVTCINLIEIPTNMTPLIKVGAYDTSSCWATMGWPGTRGAAKVNLGWCNTMGSKGSMIHEVGHVIGMHHEQKRGDAQTTYYGKGPHLKMYWENIPSKWVPQWLPHNPSYIGSKDDGAGDPVIGYEPYDYGSIMHYGLGNNGDTYPPEAENLIGNRAHLSQGDIANINDMYQCKRLAQGVTKTTTTTTTLGPDYIYCGFERPDPYCGVFSQSTTDSLDWSFSFDFGGTPTDKTGPSGPKDGSQFAYLYARDGSKWDRAILETTPALGVGANISFWWSMVAAAGKEKYMGTFSFRVNGKDLLHKEGVGPAEWNFESFDLPASPSGLLLQFMAVKGGGWEGDVAIDRVIIYKGDLSQTPAATTTTTPAPALGNPSAELSAIETDWNAWVTKFGGLMQAASANITSQLDLLEQKATAIVTHLQR